MSRTMWIIRPFFTAHLLLLADIALFAIYVNHKLVPILHCDWEKEIEQKNYDFCERWIFLNLFHPLKCQLLTHSSLSSFSNSLKSCRVFLLFNSYFPRKTVNQSDLNGFGFSSDRSSCLPSSQCLGTWPALDSSWLTVSRLAMAALAGQWIAGNGQ